MSAPLVGTSVFFKVTFLCKYYYVHHVSLGQRIYESEYNYKEIDIIKTSVPLVSLQV